jgi:hypothetical protein
MLHQPQTDCKDVEIQMTQLGEGVDIGIMAPSETPQQESTVSCKWSNCKSDHPGELQYPNDGNVSRGGGLRAELVSNDRQPWKEGNFGIPTKPILLSNGKVKKAADGSDFTEYRLEAHHLVPIKQVDETSTLKSNAVLAGWDIDALVNGMLLPADSMDIAIHHLQVHEGSHGPKYTMPITRSLEKIEEDFENMCHGKSDTAAQSVLKEELEALSSKAQRRILAIRGNTGNCWELHSSSLVAFRTALSEYARRKVLNAKLGEV